MPRVLLEFGYNHRHQLGAVGGVEETVTSTGSSRVTSTVVDRANATRLTTTVFSGNTNARIENGSSGKLVRLFWNDDAMGSRTPRWKPWSGRSRRCALVV
ncbi:MAG: hypothetical protein KDK99_22450, partial [Verrucomicrobiales bacterium]|nr:hypothetical protein [Verrucomicrobiales bacterium]